MEDITMTLHRYTRKQKWKKKQFLLVQIFFQPYRPPSESDVKLREIQSSLQRYSQGSIENLTDPNHASARETIIRVISSRIRRESRSGSQPNLSQDPYRQGSNKKVYFSDIYHFKVHKKSQGLNNFWALK